MSALSPSDVYTESLGIWLERLYHVDDVVEGTRYVCETNAGRIRFDGPRGPFVLGAQVLATVAGGTWLWGWANTQAGFPDAVLVASRRVRDIAHERNFPSFEKPVLAFSDYWTEQKYAVMACGLLDGGGTFRWNWGEGTIFFLLEDLPPDERLPWERATSVLRELFERPDEVDFDEAALAYLRRRAAAVTVQADGIIVAEFPGRRLTIENDGDELSITF